MPILKILVGGVVAGILANATGYLITGRLFHPYQAKMSPTGILEPRRDRHIGASG